MERPVRITRQGTGHRVEVGGHDLSNMVTGLSLEIDPRVGPVLKLVLIVGPVDVETGAVVRVDGVGAEALKALGWTPPPESGSALWGRCWGCS